MKILFLTTVLPSKKSIGSEVASQCFIDALAFCGHEVLVVGYVRKNSSYKLSQQEVSVGERYIETKNAKFHFLVWMALSFLLSLPYSAAKYYSKSYINIVKNLLRFNYYDLVVLDHPQLEWLVELLVNKVSFAVVAHNVEHEIYLNSFRTADNFISKLVYQREACLIKKSEDHLSSLARQTWTLTSCDGKYFTDVTSSTKVRVFALPSSLETFCPEHVDKEFDVGIIGSWSWKANVEGLHWFLNAVYPLLTSQLSVHIAGRDAEWLKEKFPRIIYRGFVPDSRVFMAQANVVAIPTLSGGGIQIKTLDAIASGSSIVATPVALRGILDPPPTLQVTEHADLFASMLVEAVSSPPQQCAYEKSQEWYHDRRNQFLTDIACATNTL